MRGVLRAPIQEQGKKREKGQIRREALVFNHVAVYFKHNLKDGRYRGAFGQSAAQKAYRAKQLARAKKLKKLKK